MAGYIGTQAVSVNTTSATISDDLSVGDDLTVTDDATIGGTLGVTGVVTANAGVVVDEMTLDADTLTATDDFIIDAVGEIVLDSATGITQYKDGGTEFLRISESSGDAVIQSTVQDKKIFFSGDDNGGGVNALILDMADAGTATFSHDIKLADGNIARFGTGADLEVFHNGSHGFFNNTTGDTNLQGVGDVFIDAGTDIILDTDSGVIRFKDNTATWAIIARDGSSFVNFYNGIQDADTQIQGNDGGATVVAVRFDMSDAGSAFFNDKVIIGLSSGHATDADITVGSASPSIFFHDTTGSAPNSAITANSGVISFKNGGTGTEVSNLTERLQINNSGLISTNVDINTNISVTNSKDGSAADFGLIRIDADATSYSASTRAIVVDFSNTDHSSAQIAFVFAGAQGVKGSITSTGNTSCSFSTSSDERLKTDIQDLTDGLTTINTLKPRKYKWISEGEDAKYDHGFIAQELYEDYSKPVLVGGEDPKTEPWSVENQSLVPILVKALQEADAKIEALTLRVTALEG